MTKRLEGHAGRHGAVADDGYCAPIAALAGGRNGHAEGGADGSARMAHGESVVFALRRGGEGRQPTALLDGMQAIAPTRQHFVRIGLVPHVPDQLIDGGVIHVMKCDRQLDGAQACGEVAATGADALDQKFAQFHRKLRQLAGGQPAQIRRGLDAAQQGIGAFGLGHEVNLWPL